MHRLILALILVLPLTLASQGVLAATKYPRTTKAQRVVKQMLAALQHESRIQVVGTVRGSARPAMTFTFRYQSPGKEEYWASTPRKKSAIGSKTLTSLHYILVGSSTYSYVASRWYKLRGSSLSGPVDVLSLNANGASCCVTSGIRPGETVRYKGTTTWHGNNAYVLVYRGASSSGGAFGMLYVSTSSYLPRGYTSTNATEKTTGTFTVTYGGNFTISAPKT